MALGLPAKKRTSSRGDTWSVDTAAAVAWVVAQAVAAAGGVDGEELDANEQRARLLAAQAGLAELTLAERRAELIPADQVVAGWQASIARARSLLLALPMAVAEEVVLLSRKGEPAVRARLTTMIHDALSELATSDPLDDEDEGEEAVVEEGGGDTADGRTG